MKKSISYYKAKISKATTKENLHEISYNALKTDEECTVFSKKYSKIIEMCVFREIELGL